VRYRADRLEAKLTLTNHNSTVSTSWKPIFCVCYDKVKWMHSFYENPLIANGAEVFKMKVALKLQKSYDKSRRLGKMSIFLQDRLK
jgi:hypothetical protein